MNIEICKSCGREVDLEHNTCACSEIPDLEMLTAGDPAWLPSFDWDRECEVYVRYALLRIAMKFSPV